MTWNLLESPWTSSSVFSFHSQGLSPTSTTSHFYYLCNHYRIVAHFCFNLRVHWYVSVSLLRQWKQGPMPFAFVSICQMHRLAHNICSVITYFKLTKINTVWLIDKCRSGVSGHYRDCWVCLRWITQATWVAWSGGLGEERKYRVNGEDEKRQMLLSSNFV